MGSLKLTACMKVVSKMGEMDQESLLDRLDRYTSDGVPKDRAQVMAASDTLAELIDERREFMAMLREQHPDLFRVTNAIPEDQDVEPDSPDIRRSAKRAVENLILRATSDADAELDIQASARDAIDQIDAMSGSQVIEFDRLESEVARVSGLVSGMPDSPRRKAIAVILDKIDAEIEQAIETGTMLELAGKNGANARALREELAMASGEITRSPARNDMGFYSALAKGVGDMQTKSAPAGAWKTQIKGLVNKGQVKQDEIEWSGLEDFLDLQEGKVTKDQILEYLRGNGVQVEEVVLDSDGARAARAVRDDAEFRLDQARAELNLATPSGLSQVVRANLAGWAEDAYAGDAAAQKKIDALDLNQDALDAIREYGKAAAEYNDAYRASQSVPGTKYGKYALPGGENYREVLLTLPEKKPVRARSEFIAEMKKKYGRDDWYKSASEGELLAFESLRDEAIKERSKSSYTSNHWDQPNVLAHIRINDRTDADGKRVLFVEEIQSDFQQDYRKSKAAIKKAVESDFEGIVARMKKAGVLEVVCD